MDFGGLMNAIRNFMISFFIGVLFLIIFTSINVFALSVEYQKQLQIGCYANSKQYLGLKRAKEYCLCTIEMLNKKFTDKQIDEIFNKKPEEVIEKTEFASTHCEKNEKAF